MAPILATIIVWAGIFGLFYLDRGDKSRVSKSIWIPTAWLFMCISRPVSEWLGMRSQSDLASMYLEGSPIDAAAAGIIELIALFVVIRRRGQVFPILRRNWLIGLFFIYAGISISWCDFPLVALKHWIKAIGDVMMVLIVLTESSAAGALKRVVTRLGFVLLPLSVLFIKFYPQLGRRLTNSWTMEPVGVCDQKNSLGILCYIIGLGLLWRFLSIYAEKTTSRNRQRLLAIGTVLAMAAWLLWMCNSLTSICALSMGSVAMFLCRRPAFRRNPILVHSLISSMLAVALYALFFQSSGGLVQGLGRDPTLSGRSEGWQIMLSIPNNRLIGTGYDNFWLGDRLQKLWEAFPNLPIGQAHNGYLEVFLNLGWIGVALLGVLIATGYRNVIRAYRVDSETGSLRLAFLLAVVINGCTEGIFRMMSPPWIILLLATAVASWAPRKRLLPDANNAVGWTAVEDAIQVQDLTLARSQ